MAILLASLDEAKTFIGAFSDTSDDAELTTWMEGLSARLERFLNRDLKSQEYTEQFDSDGYRSAIWVRGIPIASTPAVQLWDDPDRTFAAVSKVASTDYAVYADEGRLQLDAGSFAGGNRSIRATYTGGYAETSNVLGIPDDLKQAFLIQLRYEWENRNKIGLTGQSTGPGASVTLMEKFDLQPVVRRSLTPFRRVPWS